MAGIKTGITHEQIIYTSKFYYLGSMQQRKMNDALQVNLFHLQNHLWDYQPSLPQGLKAAETQKH